MIICVFGLLSCTAVPPLTDAERKAQAESVRRFFVTVRQNIRKGRVDDFHQSLSSDTKKWIYEMQLAAESEPLNFLSNRPFFEVLGILALRVQVRTNPAFQMTPRDILRKVVLYSGPVRRSLTKQRLGPFKIARNKAEVGLHKAPNVPVFFFTFEDNQWRFDLVRSLPLILLGAESTARQRKQDVVSQAVFILEKAGGIKVLDEDLFR